MHAETMLLVDHRQGEVVEDHVLLEQGMGADHDADLAGGQSLQHPLARLALVAPGQQGDPHPGGGGQRLDGGKVLAGQDFRGCHDGGLGARLDRAQRRQQRDHRLAAAHVALKQAQHADGFGHVGVDLGQRAGLGAGQRPRQCRQNLGPQRAVAAHRPALQLAHVGAHHGQGQLVGEQFVIGQPAAGGRILDHRAVAVGAVQGVEGGVPGRAFLAGQPGLVLPFGQIGRAVQGGPHRLCHHAGGQAGGQRIDRLHRHHLILLGRGNHVVGMSDLDFVVEMLDQAADHPPFALGQLATQPVLAAVEEHQVQKPGLVRTAHAIGSLGAGGGEMGVHMDQQGRHLARRRLGHLGVEAAVDHPRGQVPQQVHHPLAAQPGVKRRQLGADAGQCGQRCEQRVEQGWAHERRAWWLTEGRERSIS